MTSRLLPSEGRRWLYGPPECGAGAVGALSAGIVLDASGLSALGASMGAILVGVILLLFVPRTSWRAGVAAATTP